MKGNLIDWLKSKGSRRKRNNKKIGKRERRLDWTCYTKFMMTEKEKSETIKKLSKKNWEKSNKIRCKLREEWENMKLCNKLVAKQSINDPSKTSANFFSKLLKSKREEEWFWWSFKRKSNNNKMLGNSTVKRLNNVRDRVRKCWKLLKRLLDCFDIIEDLKNYGKR